MSRSRRKKDRLRKLMSGELKSTHHLTPRSRGGDNKKSNKRKVPALDHNLWHLFVGDSLPEEAAEKLSLWIDKKYKFFAIPKGEDFSVYSIVQKINQWLGDNSDLKIKVILKQSKIIRFHSSRDSVTMPKISS